LEAGQLRLAEAAGGLDDDVEELDNWALDGIDEVPEFDTRLELDWVNGRVEVPLFVGVEDGGDEDDTTPFVRFNDEFIDDEAGRLDDWIAEGEIVVDRLEVVEETPIVPMNLAPLTSELKLTAPWQDFS
jgi:hypothetical protein